MHGRYTFLKCLFSQFGLLFYYLLELHLVTHDSQMLVLFILSVNSTPDMELALLLDFISHDLDFI